MKKTGAGKGTRSRLRAPVPMIALLLLIILIVGSGIYYWTRPCETPPLPTPPPPVSTLPEPLTYAARQTTDTQRGTLSLCSFNIQFLGSSKDRDNDALASILKPYDLVVIQELVAAPYPGVFPNRERYKPDPEAARFFDAMRALGFDYILSEEDTGTGDAIHSNGTNTEWFVAFFRANKVGKANDLPSGFLAEDRSNNDDYERVPYVHAPADCGLCFAAPSTTCGAPAPYSLSPPGRRVCA